MKVILDILLPIAIIVATVALIDYVANRLWLSKTRHRRASDEEDKDQIMPKQQHKKPCRECPFSRKSEPGDLGFSTPIDFVQMAMSEHKEPCATHQHLQCAGLAIFRANICKGPRDKSILSLRSNHKLVFSDIYEFIDHHSPFDPED